MPDLNEWYGMGRICDEPKLLYDKHGGAILTIPVWVILREEKGEEPGKSGNWDVIVYRGLALDAHNWAKKDMKLFVRGRLGQKAWKGPHGDTCTKTAIIATYIRGISPDKEEEPIPVPAEGEQT